MSSVECCQHGYPLEWDNKVCPDCMAKALGITLPSGEDRGKSYHIGALQLVTDLKNERDMFKQAIQSMTDENDALRRDVAALAKAASFVECKTCRARGFCLTSPPGPCGDKLRDWAKQQAARAGKVGEG